MVGFAPSALTAPSDGGATLAAVVKVPAELVHLGDPPALATERRKV